MLFKANKMSSLLISCDNISLSPLETLGKLFRNTSFKEASIGAMVYNFE